MILYYTCNTHNIEIEEMCRKQLAKIGLPIVSVSLNKDIDFGDIRIRIDGQRSPEMMLKQIIAGLEACDGYVFLAENDVLYDKSHFIKHAGDKFYFNTNVWKWKWGSDLCVWTDDLQQLSGISGKKEILLNYFKSKGEFNRHYEPKENTENYQPEYPNIDIRHDKNITKSKWSPEDFRNKKYAKGFKTSTIYEKNHRFVD